jgi:hypothetical protein
VEPQFEEKIPALARLDLKLPTPINSADGFTLRWTPDPNAQHLQISFSGSLKGGGHATAMCEVPDAAGQLVVQPGVTNAFMPDEFFVFTADRFSFRTPAPGMSLLSEAEVTASSKLR